MVAAGWNGRKSGRGFYDYSDPGNPKAAEVLVARRKEKDKRTGAEYAERRRKKITDGLREFTLREERRIAYITFNRPKVLNALNRKTVEELQHALLERVPTMAVRALILTGAGRESVCGRRGHQRTGVANAVNGKEFSLFGKVFFICWRRWGSRRSARSMDLRWAVAASWRSRARFESPAKREAGQPKSSWGFCQDMAGRSASRDCAARA